MTFVEFFDRVSSENIASALAYRPERLIIIGTNSKLMGIYAERYARIFAEREQDIDLICKTVSAYNIEKIVTLFESIVETYDDCVFDITGGDELYVLALGKVYAKYPDKIQIHKLNIGNNSIFDYDNTGTTKLHPTPALTCKENIEIYGGTLVYGEGGKTTRKWEITPEFLADIDIMWRICKKNVRLWNTQIGVFEMAEALGRVKDDGLTTAANVDDVKASLSRYRTAYRINRAIIDKLINHGLIRFFENDGKTLTITYKNKQVKSLLTKAGLVLEMKIFVTARAVMEDGKLVYNDCLNGAVIDWDTDFHFCEGDICYDTENEIDIMLMHNMIPIFISCKNGIVNSDELYKLSTVAERFGGQYAKKVLVATSLASLGDGAKFLRQRAANMGIHLIEDVQELNDDALRRRLSCLWKK